MAWIAFTIGLFIGSFVGILAIGLCQMAAKNERAEEAECGENPYRPLKETSL